jgi:uncharacterized protein YegP (UPF0339 family)
LASAFLAQRFFLQVPLCHLTLRGGFDSARIVTNHTPMSYLLKRAKNGKFHFNLKAANHQVILTSEMYDSEAAAKNGIASVQKNGADAGNYEVKTAKDGQTYFVLKAGNGQVIGSSEMYKTEASAKNGIASVQKNSSSTEIKSDLA